MVKNDMHQLEFYYDFGSPTSYLAYKRLLQLQDSYDLKIKYRPMLLGGVFKATGNMSPVMIPAKGAYMTQHDMPRFIRRYGVAFAPNPFFPINTLMLMRGAIAADELNCGEAYRSTIFDAMWVKSLNMGDTEIAAKTVDDAGLDAKALFDLMQQDHIKSKLKDNTEEAIKRGIFGAPTMFMGDEMYFGQDRMDFIEDALK